MNARYDPSVDELKQESERTRAALADTVCELREKVGDTAAEIKSRISPAHIKQEIRGYVREEREHLSHSIQRKITENPLQAAAIGAAIAWPAFGLFRMIPPPLLLIGAGLWLAGSQGKRSVQDLKSKVSDLTDQASAAAGDMADRFTSQTIIEGETVSGAVRKAGTTVSHGMDSVATRVREAAHDARDVVSRTTSEVRDAVTKTTSEVMEAGTSKVQAVKDMAVRNIGAVQETASQAVERSRTAVKDMADQNPLLLAGLGVAVGAMVAALIPKSTAESRMVGSAANAVMAKARSAASQGVERAKTLAAEVVDEVATAATREGLDPNGMKKAADKVVSDARAAVDRGVQTAFSETSPAKPLQSPQDPSKWSTS